MNWTQIPAEWMRSHLSQIAFSITAMFLVIGGPYINSFVKTIAQHFHWLLRYALFVLLSTVGYGIITHYGLQNVRGFLIRLSNGQLIVVVCGVHLVLAWLLKRDRAI